jgi:hypothetical protein
VSVVRDRNLLNFHYSCGVAYGVEFIKSEDKIHSFLKDRQTFPPPNDIFRSLYKREQIHSVFKRGINILKILKKSMQG